MASSVAIKIRVAPFMAPFMVVVYCDLSERGWTLVTNVYDSPEDDAPNELGWVTSGWEQVGNGQWRTPVQFVDKRHGVLSSASLSLSTVEALHMSANQSNLKICFVNTSGDDVICRSSHDGGLDLRSYNFGSSLSTNYADLPFVYSFGRLAGFPGSQDGYQDYQDGWGVGKTPEPFASQFSNGVMGWGDVFNEHARRCNAFGVWHATGDGISYKPEELADNELGTSQPSCGAPLVNPSPNSYGFRLYVAP